MSKYLLLSVEAGIFYCGLNIAVIANLFGDGKIIAAVLIAISVLIIGIGTYYQHIELTESMRDKNGTK